MPIIHEIPAPSHPEDVSGFVVRSCISNLNARVSATRHWYYDALGRLTSEQVLVSIDNESARPGIKG
jgi:hypothetical protein